MHDCDSLRDQLKSALVRVATLGRQSVNALRREALTRPHVYISALDDAHRVGYAAPVYVRVVVGPVVFRSEPLQH